MYALCLIVLSLSISLQNKTHDPLTKNSHKQNPNAQSEDKESSSSNTIPCINCEVNEQPTKTQKEKEDEAFDRTFQHFYWGATILGVGGGLVLLWFVGKQGQAIINTERAWVMAELAWTPMYGSITQIMDTNGQRKSMVTVRLRYRNDGKTPAWVDEIRARFEITQRPETRPDIRTMEPIKSGILPYGPVPLGIGANEYVDFSLECIGQEELGKQNIVYGVIYYRDAFKRKRHTFFGFRLLGDNNIIYLPQRPEYNKHT
jgi:hypothetical protein